MKRLSFDGLDAILWPHVAEHPDFHDGYTPIRLREEHKVRTEPVRRLSIIVTKPDARALWALVQSSRFCVDRSTALWLETELMHALVVEPHEVPPDVVTMNSWVVYEDELTGAVARAKLVYPSEGRDAGHVSVLTPLGTAVLGLRVNQRVSFFDRDGPMKRLRVLSVPFQPERAHRSAAPARRAPMLEHLRTSDSLAAADPQAEE